MGKAYGICGAAQNDWIAPLVYAACAQISILRAFLLLPMLMDNSKAATANVNGAISNVSSAVSVLNRFGSRSPRFR
jgi:hypothetical protein